MTDKEIIKALECCFVNRSCTGCSQYGKDCCIVQTGAKALDLINRQQAKIANLEIELKAMRGAANSYKAEVERLQGCVKTEEEVRAIAKETIYNQIQSIKAEAVKEFAERLIQKDGEMNHIFDDCADILVPEEYKKGRDEKTKEIRQTIDNLVKEMVGEE